MKVIDPETGEECPVGVQGEMCNRGYNTMKGYYKNPQATAEVIDKNGFLHSGDLAELVARGKYYGKYEDKGKSSATTCRKVHTPPDWYRRLCTSGCRRSLPTG